MKKLSELSPNQIMAGVYIFLLLVFILLVSVSCTQKEPTHRLTITYAVYYSNRADTITASYEAYENSQPSLSSSQGTNTLYVTRAFGGTFYIASTTAPIQIIRWHRTKL